MLGVSDGNAASRQAPAEQTRPIASRRSGIRSHAGSWRTLVAGIIALSGALLVAGCATAGGAAATDAPGNLPSPASSGSASIAGLPIIERPAADAAGQPFAVLISGDGGWASPDKGLSNALVARGVPVVGLSAPRYFARRRTPDGGARDLARMIRHYTAAWGRDDVVVIGYSRGADVAPSMVSRLPDELRRRVALVALLGPSHWSGFEFHIVDALFTIHWPNDLPMRAEIARLRGTPVLCIYGRHDRHAICPSLDTTLAHTVARAGGHRVARREGPALADTILAALGDAPKR